MGSCNPIGGDIIKTELFIRNKSNELLDISDLVISVKIEGDYKQGARKLTCSYASSSIDTSIDKPYFEEFSSVMFYQDGKIVFLGTIYEISKDSASSTISFYAYDEGVRTLKVKTAYNFTGHTVTNIVKGIVKTFEIPLDSFVESDVQINKVFIGKSLYEILMSVYTDVSKKTGKKYQLEWTPEGKMRICEKGIITLDVTFEEYNNLISSSYTVNIDNVVNSVAILDESLNYVKDVQDQETIKQYGIFRDVIKQSGEEDATEQAKSMLKSADKTCKLSGFGDYTCITGRAVTVNDSMTGLKGLFYIDSDTHTWTNGVYTIDLDLNFKNIMNEMDVSEKQEESTGIGKGGTTVSGGTEYPAEFTAYYPSNDPMQGGFKASNGETLDPSKLTCAAPPEVAFGTTIQVLNTGTGKDNTCYRVNDRGGAIKIVNGVYKIDLLMKDRKTAYAFGRRKGKVKIGVTVTKDQGGGSSSTGGRQDIVEKAKTKLGTRYVWGATGPTVFDCSGLAQWCNKQVGINIPRTSLEQSRGGKSVSKNDLKPGDLVFFKTTPAPVGHVGIYVGNGRMIHTSTPSKPCRYDEVFTGHYGQRYVNARRYW